MNRGSRPLVGPQVLWAALLLSCAPAASLVLGQQGPVGRSPAADLMGRGLHADAARILEREIKERPEAECGTKFLMLGECFYLEDKYAEARPWYQKALKFLPEGKNRRVAEFRLVCVAYRMGDQDAAFQRTDEFVKAYPDDERGGTLLLFKMQTLARRGRSAESDLAKARAAVAARATKYGAAIDLSADKILTDFYLAHEMADKAVTGYMNIVQNFRKASAEYAAENRAVPASLEKARDYAALQLAKIALSSNDKAEAVKWLDSIRFDEELKRESRLRLAQIAYQDADYRKAESYLLDGDFLKTVPAGKLRSDMYLLLGFCAKRAAQPSMTEVFRYFREVQPDSPGYAQAQMGMADTAERWRRLDLATEACERACVSPKYEPEALAKLGSLYLAMAEEEADEKARNDLYDKAVERLGKLATKYPGSPFARQIGDPVQKLLAKGKVVKAAVSDADMIREWEQAAQKAPGTETAARALISAARLHQKTVLEEKTDRFIKAPDFVACLNACDRLLSRPTYGGGGLTDELWRDMQAEALYYRGLCHVSSLGQKPIPRTAAQNAPVFLPAPDVNAALTDLRRAQELASAKQTELAKNIEMVLLEAMFKSGDDAQRCQAEERFRALVEKYGAEPRFQKLAMDLGQWHQDQGHWVEAAEMYRGVATRGAGLLPQDDLVKVLFMGGKLYSKAAQAAQEKPARRTYAIYIYPREVVRVAGLLESHKPCQARVNVAWPSGEIPAEEALRLLSRASGIPFVWNRQGGKAPVGQYLATRRVRPQTASGTVADFLKQILDLESQELSFDIGLTDGEPTVDPRQVDASDPEAKEAGRVLEILRRSDWATRYEPLTRGYGAWEQVHRGKTMMFAVVKRIEEVSDTKVQWAPGVSEEDALAAEFDRLPKNLSSRDSLPCAALLAGLLEPLGLMYRVIPRDAASDLYEKAKECFNEIRRVSPKTAYGEQSLFLLALNYYHRGDHERMKIILQEYLKVFDSPSFAHYHQACFWVGWVLEREKRFRDASRYYNRAAEESLVVYRPAQDESMPDRESLTRRISYDTRCALESRPGGALTNASLEGALQEFVRLSSGVELRVDGSALQAATNLNVRTARPASVLDVLCETLGSAGLTFRPENADPATAEKAYYRMAVCDRNEGLNEQALAGCRCLLDRYPKTKRRRDALKLQIEIFKALKDYASVLATLGELRPELQAEGQAYKVDFEMAWIYQDLCRYDDAVRHFRDALAAVESDSERVSIRDGYARALYRAGRHEDALREYESLLKGETEPVRSFVAEVMIWYLRRATGRESSQDLPAAASSVIRAYDALGDEQRRALSRSAYAKVTWVYYVTGLFDLLRGDLNRALDKFDASANSPDDWLAAEAIYQAAQIHLKAGRLEQAKESLDYLLFSTKSAEGEVRALHALGMCHRQLGETDKAEARFDRLIAGFPDSPYAKAVQAEREERRAREAAGPKTTQTVETGSTKR